MGLKLQWAPTTLETAEAAQSNDFFRISDSVVLVYSAKANPLLRAADERFLQEMTADETEWLQECIVQAANQKASRNRKKAQFNDKAFMEAFERELLKERENVKGREETQWPQDEKASR